MSIEGSRCCSISCLPGEQVRRSRGQDISGHTSLVMCNPVPGFDCCSPVFYQDCTAIGEAAVPIHQISGGFRNGYYTPLDHPVLDEPSPPATKTLEEVEPEEYYARVGNDGRGLRVPTDLDESICRYLDLSAGDRARFDRATFWLDMTSRQWNISASASFAAFVSATEALTERGLAHQFTCPVCGGHTQHEVPGATRRFKDFLETYAPGAALAARRDEMYALRSGILHGSKLIEMDYALAFGWDPPWWNQRELLWDLSSLTRIALRNWLKNPLNGGRS